MNKFFSDCLISRSRSLGEANEVTEKIYNRCKVCGIFFPIAQPGDINSRITPEFKIRIIEYYYDK